MPVIGVGLVAIHTWIAIKGTGDTEYTVYDVTDWRSFHGQSVKPAFDHQPIFPKKGEIFKPITETHNNVKTLWSTDAETPEGLIFQ
jgi:hypothetical protein